MFFFTHISVECGTFFRGHHGVKRAGKLPLAGRQPGDVKLAENAEYFRVRDTGHHLNQHFRCKREHNGYVGRHTDACWWVFRVFHVGFLCLDKRKGRG